MGTTFSSVHVYRSEAITEHGRFRSFSEGWQTYLPEGEVDAGQLQKFARKLSKLLPEPVLWFSLFDSDKAYFSIYQGGKQAAAGAPLSCTHVFRIPALVGYGEGQKRRIAQILSDTEGEEQTALLEEFFGVCLLPLPELLEEEPEALCRQREDTLYRAFQEKAKALAIPSGKHAPVQVELVHERDGKLFYSLFNGPRVKKSDCFLFGYETAEPEARALRPMRFRNGKLESISQVEYDSQEADLEIADKMVEDKVNPWPRPSEFVFTRQAPAAFQGKSIILDRNFNPEYVFACFDHRERAIFEGARGTLLVVNASMEVIAKLRIKGDFVCCRDGYILTAGSGSFYAYCYDPGQKVRIYRILDKEG